MERAKSIAHGPLSYPIPCVFALDLFLPLIGMRRIRRHGQRTRGPVRLCNLYLDAQRAKDLLDPSQA
jgi:hypothetical protein